jgi:hypothetical protein
MAVPPATQSALNHALEDTFREVETTFLAKLGEFDTCRTRRGFKRRLAKHGPTLKDQTHAA